MQPPHVLAKGRILFGPFLFFLPAGGAFLQRCLRLFGTGLQLAVLFVQLIDQLPLTAQNFDQIRPAQLAQFFIVHRKSFPCWSFEVTSRLTKRETPKSRHGSGPELRV